MKGFRLHPSSFPGLRLTQIDSTSGVGTSMRVS
jgi:hypothetical protein